MLRSMEGGAAPPWRAALRCFLSEAAAAAAAAAAASLAALRLFVGRPLPAGEGASIAIDA